MTKAYLIQTCTNIPIMLTASPSDFIDFRILHVIKLSLLLKKLFVVAVLFFFFNLNGLHFCLKVAAI